MKQHLFDHIKTCPSGVALMGLDVGKKTIGVSVSDSAQMIAMPVTTIKRTKFTKDLLKIEALASDYNIKGYIFGYPLNMDGSEGGNCQSVRDFVQEFERQVSDKTRQRGVWVGFWDERLSTATVDDIVDKAVNISKRRAKDSGLVDKLAARIILQWALDYLQVNRI